MTYEAPDLETLRDYADGELAPDAADAVRRWLVAGADALVLELLDSLLADAAHRRVRLAHWATAPLRAQLARLMWRVPRAIAHSLRPLPTGTAPIGGALRGSTAAGVVQPDLHLEASIGQRVELVIEVGAATWVAAFGIDMGGTARVLVSARLRRSSGDRVGLGGVALDTDGEDIEVVVFFSERGPLPIEQSGDAREALVHLLEMASTSETDISILRATVVQTPTLGGKHA